MPPQSKPARKNPLGMDMIAAGNAIDGIEDPLLGLVQALLIVRPTVERRLGRLRSGPGLDGAATPRGATPTWFLMLTNGMIRSNCRSSPPGPCSQTIKG